MKIAIQPKIYHSFLLFLCFTIVQIGYSQFTIPKKPDFQTSVYDYANVLSSQEKADLEQKLIRYSDTTSTQIVVVTTKTIEGENIGLLSVKWAQEWGIGQKGKDNGVFILLAEKEKSIWISPGYGVDDRLTAGIVGELTRNIIIPEFKAGSYYNGLDKGSKAIFEILNGKYKGTRKKEESSPIFGGILFFIIIIIILYFIVSKNNKGGGNSGNRGGGFDLSDIIILSSLGRGVFDGKGSSRGGGGFGGGFGGGGFSGGGSGGSW